MDLDGHPSTPGCLCLPTPKGVLKSKTKPRCYRVFWSVCTAPAVGSVAASCSVSVCEPHIPSPRAGLGNARSCPLRFSPVTEVPGLRGGGQVPRPSHFRLGGRRCALRMKLRATCTEARATDRLVRAPGPPWRAGLLPSLPVSGSAPVGRGLRVPCSSVSASRSSPPWPPTASRGCSWNFKGRLRQRSNDSEQARCHPSWRTGPFRPVRRACCHARLARCPEGSRARASPATEAARFRIRTAPANRSPLLRFGHEDRCAHLRGNCS